MLYTPTKGRMKNPVKHPRQRFLQKQIMAFSCKIFLEKALSQTPDWVRNTPLQRRDHNDWEKPMANSFTISKLPAIKLGIKITSSSLRKILLALWYILKSDQNTKPYSDKTYSAKRYIKDIKTSQRKLKVYSCIIIYVCACIYTYIHT